MADGKWVPGLTPDTPAIEAARAVLPARFAAVRDRLGPAAAEADEDVENVHQLRVATRRAGAAVRIFGDLLPKRRVREARAVLRAVRRAAGEARDWDVFLDLITDAEALQTAEPAADFLTGYAFGERAAAQVIMQGVAEAQAEDLHALTGSIAESVRPPRDQSIPETFGELAVGQMDALFDEFAAEVEAGPRTEEQLHQLRITGKRVRYSMEVFAGCFGMPFTDELYPAVERVQTILGAVQDGSVAIDRLMSIYVRVRRVRPDIAARVRPGFTALTREVRHRVRDEKRAFQNWVREWGRLVSEHPLSGLLATTAG